MPKASVIIATRNRCSLLPRAVASAHRASGDAEIVVVDDASEDQTPEVCDRLDVRCIRLERRLGLGAARNIGLIASSSPYISFLDDDDMRLPGSIDAQIELLEAQPAAGMVYGKVFYGNAEGQVNGSSYPEHCPQGDVFWELLRWNFIPCPTVVFRRTCLKRIGLLDEEAPGIEDWDLWVRIAELYLVIAVNKAVAIWRQGAPGSDQFTSHAEKLHREAHRLHRDKWLRLPRVIDAGAARRREVARDFASQASQQLVWAAASRLKAGHLLDSTRVALAGARMYPMNVSKKIFSLSTLRSLRRGAEHYWRTERT
jgi:glycosyltransferase involved in cell wall biosynthesis